MNPIRVLPEAIASRIAAGEVIERPASVVKELLENSVDAQATRVRVELVDGGRARIRVTDNGHGMDPEACRLALQRHATSKISALEDLQSLTSFGFRGEALPSIAAVARLELISRTSGSAFAHRLVVDHGRVETDEAVAGPAGTQITVDRLFANIPARRRQLKRRETELARCMDVVQSLALARPDVGIELVHEDRVLLQAPATTDMMERIAAVLGRSLAGHLVHAADRVLLDGRHPLALQGWWGVPAVARANRQLQFIQVNGRTVQSDPLRQAVERAYRHLLPLHRYPVFILQATIAGELLDINVHPSKRTVRFSQEADISDIVTALTQRALAQADLAPRVRLRGTMPHERSNVVAEATHEAAAGLNPGSSVAETGAPYHVAPPDAQVNPAVFPDRNMDRPADATGGKQAELFGADAGDASGDDTERAFAGHALTDLRFDELTPLGTIDQTYILAESRQGLVIIDQHAAHERVMFEQLLQGAAGLGPTPRQPLSVPLVVDLDFAAMSAWRLHQATLQAIGFSGETFGDRSVILREVPLLFGGEADERTFRDVLEALAGGDGDATRLETDLARRTMASCKRAVKAHDPLSTAEQQALLAALASCRQPYTCPHGRPTVLIVTVSELERHFKRSG